MIDWKKVDGYPIFARELGTLMDLQLQLDEAINLEHRGSKNSYPQQWQIRMALLDEIGEVIHELKGDWCYWKKNQKAVDRTAVLGELADCLHFILSSENFLIYNNSVDRQKAIERGKKSLLHAHSVIGNPAALFRNFADQGHLYELLDVCTALEFTEEELIQAYKDKHAINYERLANGY